MTYVVSVINSDIRVYILSDFGKLKKKKKKKKKKREIYLDVYMNQFMAKPNTRK